MDKLERWIAGGQIQGDRARQEDAYSITPLPKQAGAKGDSWLLALADGMGGHAGGDVAAATATQAFEEGFTQAGSGQDAAVEDRLDAGLNAANEAVRAKQRSDFSLSDMGATLVVAAVIGPVLYWVSVGDSLLWLFREGELVRLNEDHSMRPLLLQLAEVGEMSREEALNHPVANQLRSVVHGNDLPLVDMAAEGCPLAAGDVVLLASDGIETLSEAALTETLQAHADDAGALTRALLDGVTAAGVPRQDNTTVLACRVAGTAAQPRAPRSRR